MRLSIIVALADNGVIGRGNAIANPLSIASDCIRSKSSPESSAISATGTWAVCGLCRNFGNTTHTGG